MHLTDAEAACRPGPVELQAWSQQLVQKAQPDMQLPADGALDMLRMLPPQANMPMPELYGPASLSRLRSWEHNRVRVDHLPRWPRIRLYNPPRQLHGCSCLSALRVS